MTLLAPMHEQPAGARKPPSAEAIYRAIRADGTPAAARAPFTAHVLACVLTSGLLEVRDNAATLSAALGLNRAKLDVMTAQWAPGARRFFRLEFEPMTLAFDEEEAQLFILLDRYRVDASALSEWMAHIVARRAMSPDHLWQDLGLLERGELTRLMGEWFPTLAAANVDNMKWKKFFYRKLCELEGFSLCAAPTCRECDDFENCFGDEDGTSMLARIARR
jgi:nitrogen fixation protein NifQ